MPVVWTYIVKATPADTQTVWVHRLNDPTPFQATWSAGAQTFTLASGLNLPWYMIINWRPL